MKPLQLIDLRTVLRMTSLSKTLLYELIKKRDFPPQIQISPRRVAWDRRAVQAWVRNRIYGDRMFREYIESCMTDGDKDASLGEGGRPTLHRETSRSR